MCLPQLTGEQLGAVAYGIYGTLARVVIGYTPRHMVEHLGNQLKSPALPDFGIHNNTYGGIHGRDRSWQKRCAPFCEMGWR